MSGLNVAISDTKGLFRFADDYDVQVCESIAFRPGDPLTVVYYVGGKPVQLSTETTESGARSLRCVLPSGTRLPDCHRVILIASREGKCYKSDAEVHGVEEAFGETTVSLVVPGWEELERRQFPRYTAILPLTVRAVGEENGEVQLWETSGRTIDLSLGGVQAQLERVPGVGSLVDVRLAIGASDGARALGVVVRNELERSVAAIHFLDYIGAARYHLHGFLAQRAS